MWFYAVAYLILPQPGKTKRFYWVVIELLAVLIIYLFLKACISSYFDSKPLLFLLKNSLFIAQSIFRGSFFGGLATGYWFAMKSVRSEHKLRLLEKENFLKEIREVELRQKVADSQLAFFKAQINPHFLFNTINFFYSNIYPLSKPLAQSLLVLSNIMRYAMNDDQKDGWGDLKTEIQVIEDYIHLNQLRFNHNLQINFDIIGIPDHKKVLSFLMITLVENAFKYGDLTDTQKPLLIRIYIHEDKIDMQIQNKIDLLKTTYSYGIGLKNLEDRLKLVYKDDYLLAVTKDETMFNCNLSLNLK